MFEQTFYIGEIVAYSGNTYKVISIDIGTNKNTGQFYYVFGMEREYDGCIYPLEIREVNVNYHKKDWQLITPSIERLFSMGN